MNREQIKVFVLTFMAYASLTSLRYGWSYSKVQMHEDIGISMKSLGVVDAFYVACYSSGMVVLGSLIHRVSLKRYVVGGILASSLSYMFFPALYAFTGLYSLPLVVVFMSVNGFFQATGWPGIMGIFGNWFTNTKKGLLMALWAMSGNIGNILSTNVCNVLENLGFSWVSNFMVTGIFGVAVALCILLFLN